MLLFGLYAIQNHSQWSNARQSLVSSGSAVLILAVGPAVDISVNLLPGTIFHM